MHADSHLTISLRIPEVIIIFNGINPIKAFIEEEDAIIYCSTHPECSFYVLEVE